MGIRSFIAVECNNATVVSNVSRIQRDISAVRADIKFVEPENLHLTLKFLGDVKEEIIDDVVGVVKRISFEPFKITVEGVGVFPNLRRPQTIWAGITNGVTYLAQVFENLDDGLSGLGFEKERRRFSPHLTLGRVRSGRNRENLVEALKEAANEKFGEVDVDKIIVKKSVLTPKGPVYSNIAESGKNQ
jgi:2'-5' RNA ligase